MPQQDTMQQKASNVSDNKPRVLLHSQRNIYSNVHFRLGLYEFEDIISQVDSSHLLAPHRKNWFQYGTRIANRLASHSSMTINPGISKIKIEQCYDLFFAIISFPRDLLHINCLQGWKDRCKISICWLNEIWIPDFIKYKYLLEILSQFDYVIIPLAGSIQPAQGAIKSQCIYLASGVDSILFSPYPNPPKRVIDVYSIGRRSQATHRTILKISNDNKMFYLYDSIAGSQVINSHEHRLLFANMAKRSRYFIVNPGKVDLSNETEGQVEFGSRFFEGAAAGTIMIGEKPNNEQFKKMFNWTDAVVDLPYGSEKIDEIIDVLDKDPERQERIRRTNIVQSLLRHDWVYRWEAILKIAGMKPMPGLLERKQRLADLAKQVQNEPTVP